MEIICGPPLSVSENMDLSSRLLDSLKERPRVMLHFYNWKHRAATYGYFTDPAQFLNLPKLRETGTEIGRRPTGGGILFHLTDLAFAFYLPANHPRFSLNTLDNYAVVNGAVVEALQTWTGGLGLQEKSIELAADNACRHFCMAKPTVYDVVLKGLKVAGGAQRRVQGGLLHQGSIYLKALPKGFLESVLLPETCVADAIGKNSWQGLEVDQQELREAMQKSFSKAFD